MEALEALYEQVASPPYRAKLTMSVDETMLLPAGISQSSTRSSTWRRRAPRGSPRAQCLPGLGHRAGYRAMSTSNLLINDGRVGAVLDLGDLAVGGPAVDLMGAWTLLPVPARRHFRQSLGVDDATWAPWPRTGPCTWACGLPHLLG